MSTFPLALCLIASAFVLINAITCDPPNAPVVCPTGPEGPDDNATLLPNPFNCSTYFVCDHGCPKEMSCGELYFNPVEKVCDFPSNVNCYIDILMPTLFPCHNEDGKTEMYPNPRNCSTFWLCDENSKGYAYLQSCPPGLRFNEDIQGCDWPENVKCENGN